MIRELKSTSIKVLAATLLLGACSGCTSLLSPMSGIPVLSLPPGVKGQSRNNLVPIPLTMLRRPHVDEYLLGPGDTLAIYIEGILPSVNGSIDNPMQPPVHFPETGSSLPPAVGYPVTVRSDGTLSLPLIDPISAKGKSVVEIENIIRRIYVKEKKILKEEKSRILVSLMRERTVRIIVVREDRANDGGFRFAGAGRLNEGPVRSSAGFTLDLPMYKNDLMHALAETGGMPGLDSKNEVRVIKAKLTNPMLSSYYFAQPFDPNANCNGPMNEFRNQNVDPQLIVIPLRTPPGLIPKIPSEAVVLEDGDMVVIESRDAEVFYTGGLLTGGQHTLPRDYDLDIFGAMAIAGRGIGQSSQSGGGMGGNILGGGFVGAPPTQLYIIRKTNCGTDVNILVDLNMAMNDPSQRIFVQPGDTLILRYKPREEVLNFSLVSFFTYGITQIFR